MDEELSMYHYKIGKYDYKDVRYTDQWTSVFQAIEENDGLPKEYFYWEKKYLNVVLLFQRIFSVNSKLMFKHVENYLCEENSKRFDKVSSGMLPYSLDLNQLKENGVCEPIEIVQFFQMSLREMVWGQLGDENGNYIAYGDNYYLLVGVHSKEVIERLLLGDKENKLFAYLHKDPWE